MPQGNIKEEIEELGYKVVYVPHDVIKDYNACYRVMYRGKLIYPPAADRLDIPLNEIWISEKWKEFEHYILFHELKEIEYRANGYTVEQAHELAVKVEDKKFKGDPKYERLKREINVASKKTLIKLGGVGEDLAQKIIENRPYLRIDELLEKIPSMKKEAFRKMKEHFWCITEN